MTVPMRPSAKDFAARTSQSVGLRPKVLDGAQKAVAVIGGRQVINLAANNYLGFVTHPKLKKAAVEAIKQYGVGAGSARGVVGSLAMHEELEEKLAAFLGMEAAVLLNTGFDANLAVLGAALSKGDVAIGDERNHESILDGVALAQADYLAYPHLDLDGLRAVLSTARQKGYRRLLVVTDGVFSLEGDVAPLPQMVELATEFGASMYVDDGHAIGVLGEGGRGSVSHFGLGGRVDIQMGAFSKALGVVGGFVACSRRLSERVRQKAHLYTNTTMSPPMVMAACAAALQLLQSVDGQERMSRLWANTEYFKTSLKLLGFNIPATNQTPITPLVVGEDEAAARFSARLFDEGVFAQHFGYPIAPRGQAQLRTIVTAEHTRTDLARAIEALDKVGREFGIIKA